MALVNFAFWTAGNLEPLTGTIYIPLGNHVSRIEFRRFLLLKAVLIPITTKAFCILWLEACCLKCCPCPPVWPVWLVLDAVNSIPKVEIALSKDLLILWTNNLIHTSDYQLIHLNKDSMQEFIIYIFLTW